MAEITETSVLPFTRERGRRLCDASSGCLQWIVGHLADGDHHLWAFHAGTILARRAIEGAHEAGSDDLEAQANAILQNAGFSNLCTGLRRRGGSAKCR